MKEAVVFEAASTEESMERVHSPLTGNALCLDAINVGSALLGTLGILMLSELNVPKWNDTISI